MNYLDRDAKAKNGKYHSQTLKQPTIAVESNRHSLKVRNTDPATNIYTDRETNENIPAGFLR